MNIISKIYRANSSHPIILCLLEERSGELHWITEMCITAIRGHEMFRSGQAQAIIIFTFWRIPYEILVVYSDPIHKRKIAEGSADATTL